MTYEMKFTGSKYRATKDMDIAAIAKLVRAEIKAAIKDGKLPAGMKTSVRIKRYSGGQSMDVDIKSFGPGHLALNPARVKWDAENPYGDHHHAPQHRPAAAARAIKMIDAMLSAYNFDDSDSMTDYFHVRFYGHATVDWEYDAEERKRIAAGNEFPDLGIPDPLLERLAAMDAADAAEADAAEPATAPAPEHKIKIQLAGIPAIPVFAMYAMPTA